MGKKKKKNKKWWWEDTDYGDGEPKDQIDTDLFGNTIRQHNERLHGSKTKDKDIYTYDEEEDSVASPYDFDYGWDRKLNETPSEKGKRDKSGKTGFDYAADEFRSGYGAKWRGYEYYKTQQLSYKYVQQMANTLAAKHRITVTVGNTWNVDLKKKTLTYNPASLVYGTKSELLATLMHEIGKLRYGTHPDKVRERYLAAYGTPAVEVLSIFEDIRVDYWMLKAYEGATEIYESAIPAVDKKIKEYRERSEIFREVIGNQLSNMFQRLVENATRLTNGDISKEEALLRDHCRKVFGVEDYVEVSNKIDEIKEQYKEDGSIFDYCGEMLRVMYDSDSTETEMENIKEKVAKTESIIHRVQKLDSTQKNADLLSNEVFPIIEDLLRDFNRDNEKIRNAFPQMAEAAIDQLVNQITDSFRYQTNRNGAHVNTNDTGNSVVRSSGPTENIIPKEWISGDYAPIRDSVMPEIRQLVRKLTFLRREEMSQKHQADQRRGTLNSKKLYKSAVGNRRVFKKLLPNSNTVQSFAFSIVVDTSGSMRGARMVHTTRALAIFAEVFKKMDIPFEIIDFSSDSRVIKRFEDSFTEEIENKIGGLVKQADGGTNLDRGLRRVKLEKQPEKNKVCIVLSDGGVGDFQEFDRDYFIPMSKKGILSMGFGIECEAAMAKLCMGNSKVLENANKLPIEFADLIKSLIKRK